MVSSFGFQRLESLPVFSSVDQLNFYSLFIFFEIHILEIFFNNVILDISEYLFL